MRSVRISPATRAAPEVDAWCERFERLCRARGVRVTAQRVAVYRAVARDLRHPTVADVHLAVRASLPSVSLATVYRTLESLAAEGLLRQVSTEGGCSRFDANVDAHQHLVCRVCGEISDHTDPGLGALRLPDGRIPGFRPETLDVRILGTCDACARSRGRRDKRATDRDGVAAAPPAGGGRSA